MRPVQALGATLTILGLVLLGYALASGAFQGSIGDQLEVTTNPDVVRVVTKTVVGEDKRTTTYTLTLRGGLDLAESQFSFSFDAWAAFLGWFLVLIGPALWQGEVPAVFKRRAGR